MRNQRGGSTTEVLLKFVLVFVISLFSFAVGTFVGQQFSESQQKIASIEKATTDRGTASISPDAFDIKPSSALTDADVDSIAEEFSETEDSSLRDMIENDQLDKEVSEALKEIENRESEKLEQAKQMEKNEDLADKIAKNENPLPQVKDDGPRIPSSLPKAVAPQSIGKFTVQVASYKTEDEAKEFAEGLKTKGFSAFYVPAKIKSQTWYRVSVGLFTSQSEAMQHKAKLYKTANLKGFVAKIRQ